MPDYVADDQEPTLEQLTLEIWQHVRDIKDIVLDIQARQKVMDERQRAIREDFDQSGASDPKGSFGTGYQKG